ncbi:CYTH and CHAD domain-containing protein [Taylorella equigenitalis]|uniref:CYTH and CHAD domain-containing protein n=1 Tax=Taylorella equigenitalis TaxID=29575 RepID=UPI000419EF64|nr:CYTH and CHAD domain-containing protein [Taylorella equigenitalis]ASY40406.1 inorganic triphosphatase [Taylorella equigenitalis]
MSEQEIKLHVPLSARESVKNSLNSATKLTLRAMYFDTPSRQLAKAKTSIRLRLEGDSWVQTLKMAGESQFSRLELNHSRHAPILDLSLYAGTAAEIVISKLTEELECRFETHIERLCKKQRVKHGTVEIAYDTGVVRAGALELPINEIEFELVSGQVCSIFDMATRWTKEHGLILDNRTKAHRGDALANIHNKIYSAEPQHQAAIELAETQKFWSEKKAQPIFIQKYLTATKALCKLTEECVDQISSNAALLAEIDTAGVAKTAKSEHVHQLRVGIRRLISNWRLFDGIAHLPNPELQLLLKEYFGRFGETRDTDVMLETILPPLIKAGMPPIKVSHYNGKPASEIAKEAEFQTLLIQIMRWVATAPNADPLPPKNEVEVVESDPLSTEAKSENLSTTAEPESKPIPARRMLSQALIGVEGASSVAESSDVPIQDKLVDIIPLTPGTTGESLLIYKIERRLSKWYKSIVNHWKTRDKADIENYHDLRKKIKKIRYALNVYENMEGASRLGRVNKRLIEAQEVFGQLNDYATAHVYFSNLVNTHKQAWFAVGWLSAHIEMMREEADAVHRKMLRRIRFGG